MPRETVNRVAGHVQRLVRRPNFFGHPTYTSYGASRNNTDFLALMHFAAKSR